MITSVFLSNNIIQAATGERNRNNYVVKGICQWEMPHGNLLNGMITDEAALIEQLSSFWQEFHLPVTGVELVVNGLAFSVRKLGFPTLDSKKLAGLIPLEYEEVEEGQQPVYDYMPYERKSRSEIKTVMAVRAVSAQIEKWVEIFKKIDVELSRVTISNITMLKYLKEVEVLQKGVSVILGIDDNSLNSFLWFDGEQKGTSTKRFFSNKGTEEFGTEIARRVSEMQQFYRSLKQDEPLKKIYTFGFDEDSLEALKTSLQNAGMEMSAEPLPGKYVDEMAAVGGLIYRDKDVNLLDAMSRQKKKDRKQSHSLKSLVIPGIILGIFLLAAAVLFGVSFYKGSKVRELEAYIQDPLNQEAVTQVDELNKRIASMQGILLQTDEVQSMVDSYPKMNSKVAYTITSVSGAGVTPVIASYDSKTGDLTVDVKAAQVTDCNAYVTALKGTGLFGAVDYSGYNFDEKDNIYKVQLHCILTENAGK